MRSAGGCGKWTLQSNDFKFSYGYEGIMKFSHEGRGYFPTSIGSARQKNSNFKPKRFVTLTAGRAIFLVHGSALMIDAWVPRWW